MFNQEEGVSRTADGGIAAIHEDQIANHADELRADPTFRMDEPGVTGEQQFREHLAKTQLSQTTQDMMVHDVSPVMKQAFAPLSSYIQQAKHKEFILAMDAALFEGGKRGIVEWDYYTFCEMAHEFTIIGQRARLEKDARFRQFLPYTVITQFKDGGKLGFALYQRTKKVGEERLGGKFSIGWGGHIDVTDVVTGSSKDESFGSGDGEPSPVINLYETIRKSSNREIGEEICVWDGSGAVVPESLPTMASNLLILDTDEVGTVHVGLIRHAFLPADYAIDAKEEELLYVGVKTLEELAGYELEGWSRLYLEHFVKSGELNRVA
jgi:predicted NUDIX family phosphoesterase